jgi:hypothetical protein
LRQTGHQPETTQLTARDAPAVSLLPGFGTRKQPGMFNPFPEYPTDFYYLFVHVQSNPTDSFSVWELYRIRPELAKTLFLLSSNSLRLNIRFLDGDDRELVNDHSGLCVQNANSEAKYAWSLRSPIGFAFGQSSVDRLNCEPSGANGAVGLSQTFRTAFRSTNDNFIYIAPYFSIADGERIDLPIGKNERSGWGLQRSYALSSEITREINTTLDALQSVKKMIASLSSDISLPPDAKNYTDFLNGLSFDEPTRSEQLLTGSLAPGPMTNLQQPPTQPATTPRQSTPYPSSKRSVQSKPPTPFPSRNNGKSFPQLIPPSRGGLQPSPGLQPSRGFLPNNGKAN